jgi:glycerol kinase
MVRKNRKNKSKASTTDANTSATSGYESNENNELDNNTNDMKIKVEAFANVLKEDYFDKLEVESSEAPKLVGAIDQGTSSTRFLLFTQQGRIAASAQMEHTQIFLEGEGKVGWHEHDPIELWKNTVECITAVYKLLATPATADLPQFLLSSANLAAIGITNQRETTIAWNRETGKPYHNAIVWDDLRTAEIAQNLAKSGGTDRFREKTGLPLSSYFAGTKVKWLLDNCEQLRTDLQERP